MHTILNPVITAIAPGGRGDVVLEANEALHAIGFDKHGIEIESLISISSELETEELLQSIEDAIRLALQEAIGEFSINVDAIDLDKLTTILNTIRLVESYDDKASILTICDGDDDVNRKLASMIEEIHNIDATNYLTTIIDVSPAFIDRVRSVVSADTSIDNENAFIEEETTPSNNSHQLKMLIEKYQPPQFLTMLADGWGLGYKLSTYLNNIDIGEEVNAAILSSELAASIVASGEEVDQAMATVVSYIEDRIDNYLLISSLSQKTRTKVNEVLQ